MKVAHDYNVQVQCSMTHAGAFLELSMLKGVLHCKMIVITSEAAVLAILTYMQHAPHSYCTGSDSFACLITRLHESLRLPNGHERSSSQQQRLSRTQSTFQSPAQNTPSEDTLKHTTVSKVESIRMI